MGFRDEAIIKALGEDNPRVVTRSKPIDQIAIAQRDLDPEAVMARVEAAQPVNFEATQKLERKDLDNLDPYNYMPLETLDRIHPGTRAFSVISMDTLDMLARVPVIDAIIGARLMQLSKYGVPQRSPFEEGYKIQLRDPKQRSSTAAQKRAHELQQWMSTCGDPRLRENATFQSWLVMCGRDSLVFDQLCSEVVYGWDGKPAGFVPVDARTIRRAKPTDQELKEQQSKGPAGRIQYVQVLNQEIIARWKPERFIFGVRNPRTDIKVNGYGYPELERLIVTIGDLVNAIVYNGRNFTNGVHATGILALMSSMDKETFDMVSQDIRGMMAGVHNAHRAVVMQLNPELKEALQWFQTTSTNKDMEYNQWLGFLLKIACAIYQMDPAEIGFVFGNEGQSGALSQAGPGERIQASKERGLWPMLRCMETWLNDKVIHRIDPDFDLLLAGYDQATEDAKQNWITKVTASHYTVDEARALDDLPPLGGQAGNSPLNGIYTSMLQYFDTMRRQDEQMAQQQAAEVAAMGMPPEGEDFDDEELTDEDLAALYPEEPPEEPVAKALVATMFSAEIF